MLKKSFTVVLLVACLAGTAAADMVCTDSSYCTVSFATTKDRITINPDGQGDTFASVGITIEVHLKDCNGHVLVGVPREEIVLYTPGLCVCPGGSVADTATDANGMTAFTGTIRGGGCVETLTVFVEGLNLGTFPVKTNSPHHNVDVGFTCGVVDASDLALFATRLGVAANYSICSDFIEDGVIDASDLGYMGAALHKQCQ